MTKIFEHLPISEEILGAYLEGNLSEQDSKFVEDLCEDYPEFKDFIDDIQYDDINEEESIYDYYPDFDSEFCLPDIPGFTEESDDIQTAVDGDNDIIEYQEDVIDEDCYDDIHNDNMEITANDSYDMPFDEASYDYDDISGE